ncbi:glycosyltransferase [Candidatus Peregrinibacteria bacterium]|nr:glycosyltransferase [Candidatus Peregrinibacteria bacterium]
MTIRSSSVSVVIPSYNEKDNIAEAVGRICSALGDALLEIIVVDDNSPDRTWEIVQNLNEPRCRLIRRMDKRGLASALADGTRAANGSIVVWLDCDLGIPPEDIQKLIEKMDEYDVAVGSRYLPGGMDTRNKFRAFLSTIFNIYARMLLGWSFRDWTSGFAAARKEALLQVPLTSEGFGEYFVEWVYWCRKKKLRMVEVPYRYGLRKSGVSKTDGSLRVFLRLSIQYAWRVLTVRMGRRSATT